MQAEFWLLSKHNEHGQESTEEFATLQALAAWALSRLSDQERAMAQVKAVGISMNRKMPIPADLGGEG